MTTLVPNELIGLPAGRVVRVLEASRGVVVRTPRGNRVGVRNAETGRLSYIHEDVLLRAKKAALSMLPEHTCIKSDGGTPGRRCRRCEQEAPQAETMPPIQVGDVVTIATPAWRFVGQELARFTLDPFPRIVSEERHAAYLNGEGADDVRAIYRDPLWRRPASPQAKED